MSLYPVISCFEIVIFFFCLAISGIKAPVLSKQKLAAEILSQVSNLWAHGQSGRGYLGRRRFLVCSAMTFGKSPSMAVTYDLDYFTATAVVSPSSVLSSLHSIPCIDCCQPKILFPSCHFLAQKQIAPLLPSTKPLPHSIVLSFFHTNMPHLFPT